MIIVKAPLRISFLGGSTDIYDFYSKEEGICLGTTIDKYVYVIIHKRFQEDFCIGYTKKEYSKVPKQIKHNLVREALIKTNTMIPIEISMVADIPSRGSGLGSSSSLLVALLKALYIHQGINIDNEHLAEEACDIEINKLNHPIGKQDQYWAAFGGLNVITFSEKKCTVNKINGLSKRDIEDLDNNLLLFHTGIARNSKDVLKTIPNNKKTFNNKKMLKILAQKGEMLLKEKRFDDFGKILGAGWKIKRKLSPKISFIKIDKLYRMAIRLGALGGKLLGAGGGGFLLFYCPMEKQKEFRSKFPLKELPFHFDFYGARGIFNDE